MKLTSDFLLICLLVSTGVYGAEEKMNCKLTVNGGLGMSGECYYDKVTGKFTDKKLQTACRSGAQNCPPSEMEVVHGGTFGSIKQEMGGWMLCWNEGGFTRESECFEGVQQKKSCWLTSAEEKSVVLCITK
jgi:hypothetical protein